WSPGGGGAAEHGRDQGREQQGEVAPLARVLRAIGQRYPGRALDAQLTERNGGRAVYRIKWLGSDGKVRDVIADARTGRILRVR
ncbi:MAG: PepSY domain-containing protein, partial [Geminicoccaceae bacterium]